MESEIQKMRYFISWLKINTVHFAEDQVITADSKDDSQTEVFTLQNTAK